MAQSFAIESYLADIAPRFASLSPAQRAIDDMLCKIKEDLLQGYATILFGMKGNEAKQATAAADIAKVADKWLPVVEGLLPVGGFVNGMAFPTPGDLAVFSVGKQFTPFVAAHSMAGYDAMQKYPKFAELVTRVAECPRVEAYVQKSTSFDSDPFGLKAL